MNKEIKRYIDEFKHLYDGEPWLDVTFVSILKKASEEDALKKTLKNLHSAAEIVCHVIAYRKFLLAQFTGEKDFDINQEKSFDTGFYSNSGKNMWNNILNTFDNNQKNLIELMEKSDDSILSKKVYNRDYELSFLIDGIIQHDAYHLGQLVILLKAAK